MILQFLATDRETLRACSQAAREFRHAALSHLARHLTVNTVGRLRECTKLVAGGLFNTSALLTSESTMGDQPWKLTGRGASPSLDHLPNTAL